MRLFSQLSIFVIVAVLLIFNSCGHAGDPVGPQQPCTPDTVFITPWNQFDPMIVEVHDTVEVAVLITDTVRTVKVIEVPRSINQPYGFTLDLLQLWAETDRSHRENGYKQHDLRFILAAKFHPFEFVNIGGFLLYEDTEYHQGQGVEGFSVGIGANLRGVRLEGDYLYGRRFKAGMESYWLSGFNLKAMLRVHENVSIGPSFTWLDYTSSSESYPFLAVRLNL